MYAGHFATAVALRGRARAVPMAVYVGAALLLDILWIGFGVTHLDRTPWTDWSHSLLMSLVWASVFGAIFRKAGPWAFAAVWTAVFSHYILDLLVQGASLYPYAPSRLLLPAVVSGTTARVLQLLLSAVLILVFVMDERRAAALSWRTWTAGCLILLLNARFLLRLE